MRPLKRQKKQATSKAKTNLNLETGQKKTLEFRLRMDKLKINRK